MNTLVATDLLLLPALLGMGKPVSQHALPTPTVVEHADGWYIALAAPGMQPKDVQVSVSKNREGLASLKIQSAEFRHALRLPAEADTNVKASLLHGLLRVHVPRLPTLRHTVAVASEASEAPTPAEGEAPHPQEACVTLAVPGIAPNEVSVLDLDPTPRF